MDGVEQVERKSLYRRWRELGLSRRLVVWIALFIVLCAAYGAEGWGFLLPLVWPLWRWGPEFDDPEDFD